MSHEKETSRQYLSYLEMEKKIFQASLALLMCLLAIPQVELSQYKAEEIIGKSPSEILALRGFRSEVHYARTPDDYYVHLVHVINPKLESGPTKRPVIFNHGLLESSTVWLINSRDVHPMDLSQCGPIPENPLAYNGTFYLNGPMMLANSGYDVWLMSMRGTDYAMRHVTLNPMNSEYWDYCLDDFALSDVPSAIYYVRKLTGQPKVGYVGHSQATFSVFALLASRPQYAEIIEPVVAVAPVSYFDHISSISRLLFIGILKGTDKEQHGLFPPNANKIRRALAEFCDVDNSKLNDRLCQIMNLLVSGKGEYTLKGFYSHLPYYTSLKVLRQFGQLIESKRFQRYDYGSKGNLARYGTFRAPSYPIKNIRSRSLFLISTKSDALSPPKDVDRFKRKLTVPIYRDLYIDQDFDHFDLIAHEYARQLVFKPILEAFEDFEHRAGGACAATLSSSAKLDIRKKSPVNYDEENDQSGELEENRLEEEEASSIKKKVKPLSKFEE